MSDALFRLSFLDRIIDPHLPGPGSRDDTSLRALRSAVLRDLEWLLNTRRIADPAPDDFPELQSSVYHYGLPDVSSMSGDSPGVHRLLGRALQRAIETYEPRLSSVRVSMPAEAAGRGSRRLQFTVEALLEVDPEPQRISFDTVLDVGRGEFEVKGSSDA